MSMIRTIAKNTAALMAANFIGRLMSFFFVMYTARHLGAGDYGVLIFAMSFTLIFGILADLGLHSLTVREVARDKLKTAFYLSNVGAIKVILSFATMALVALTVTLLDYPPTTVRVVYLMTLCVLATNFENIFYSFFRAFEQMHIVAIGQILNSSLILAGVFTAIALGAGVEAFAFNYFIAHFIGLLYAASMYRHRLSRPEFGAGGGFISGIDFGMWKPMIRQSLSFCLAGTFNLIFLYIDSVMLSFFKGDEVVGWYGAAYRLTMVFTFIPIVLSLAIYPAMSRFYVSSRDTLLLTFRRHFKYMVILIMPIAAGCTVLADRIILLIFGDGFIPSILALRILIWSLVLFFLKAPFVRLFEATDRQIIVTVAFGINAVLNIIINLYLIPRYSYVGAGAATVATDMVSFIILAAVGKNMGYSIFDREQALTLLKVTISSLVMGFFILTINEYNIFIVVLLAFVLYFIITIANKSLDEKDISMLKKLVTGKAAPPI